MDMPVIVKAVRTPVGKAVKGALADYRPDDLAALVLRTAVEGCPGLDKASVDDILLGCAMPEGEQGMNVANIAKFAAGLPFTVPAMTLNRFCSSSLQAIAMAGDSIAAGRNQVVIAGGAESMSLVPMGGHKFAPNPGLVDDYPGVYLSMGLTAERVAAKFGVNRAAQDRFAYESHMKAAKAVQSGVFREEIVPVVFERAWVGPGGKREKKKVEFGADEGPRPDTTLEALAALKPAFLEGGTVTAGNSSQMSDGAACLILMSEAMARALGLKPLARLVGYAVTGVEPEMMGIGPITAIPKALKLAGLSPKDIGLIELNEAFAAQSLAVMKALELDPARVNVNGGAIALGHPLGATGAILAVKIIHELKRRKAKYGVVSMCIGGGMGAAGVIENLP